MAPRLTRSAAARRAELLTQGLSMDMAMDIDEPQQLSSPPPTPVTKGMKKGAATLTATPKRTTRTKPINDYYLGSSPPSTPVAGEKKRKWEVTEEVEAVNALQQKLGYLGPDTSTADDVAEQEFQQEAPVKKRRSRKGVKIVDDENTLPPGLGNIVPSLQTEENIAEKEFWQPNTKARAQKTRKPRTRKSARVVDDLNQLPHNLGPIVASAVKAQNSSQEESAVREPHGQKLAIDPEVEHALKALLDEVKNETKEGEKKDGLANFEDTLEESATAKGISEKETKKKKKVPTNKYGLTPGLSPFPNHDHPTPEECQEVHDLLTAADGKNARPERIPPPSLEVTGCGEVPSVIDALIRTTLSAATSRINCHYSFEGLEKTFGITDVGIGKGSLDYEKIRIADVKDIEAAIKSGGLQKVKSKTIKTCLQKAYEEGIVRRDTLITALKAFRQECANGSSGLEVEAEIKKDAEMVEAIKDEEENPISLQYIHKLSNDEAMDVLSGYPGIGVKTAACILLFSLGRDCFAVDTHVFKFSTMLNWVPEKATRDKTFSHLEVKVPDNLKYPLHQLFIYHGRKCPKCRSQTETSASQHEDCPLDHLLTRVYRNQKRGAGMKDSKKDGNDEQDDDEPDLSEGNENVEDGDAEGGDGNGEALEGNGEALESHGEAEEGHGKAEESGEVDDNEANDDVDEADGEFEGSHGEAEDVHEVEG